jgi:hypothetical protein
MGEAKRRKDSNPAFGSIPRSATVTHPNEKYLYLSKREWADAWINGGEVPIALASTYKRDHRFGTLTPDETVIHESAVDLTKLSPMVHMGPGAGVRNFTMVGCRFNGHRIPDIKRASYYTNDGCILSFCNNYSREVGRKLGKAVCIKVLDVQQLFTHLSEQLGCEGAMDVCQYTSDHRRNHFLKSVEDAWQDEFRMFWPLNNPATVRIPSGTAEFVSNI